MDEPGLGEGAELLRLLPPPDHVGDDSARPNSTTFKPKTEEIEDARKSGLPVRVSVWDRSRTTIPEARAFYHPDAPAFALMVADVSAIRDATEHGKAMRVVRDPLPPPDDVRPGAAGHAGIEGLEKQPDEGTKEWKRRLRALAERLTPASNQGRTS